MGSGPHSPQFAAPLGSAPDTAEQVVKVHAGMEFFARDGKSIVICSSNNTPFKIGVAVNLLEAERILEAHTGLP